MISVGKHAITDGSWKMSGAPKSSTPLFTKETLQISVVAFLFIFTNCQFENLRLILSRVMARRYHWKYIKFLPSPALPWRMLIYLKRFITAVLDHSLESLMQTKLQMETLPKS